MANSMRQRLEKAEEEGLVPWAMRSGNAKRRHPIEDEGRAFDYRSQFQRDRDRIVYSRAFRRLRQKAVAGILPAYEDHRRNRLTHTLEVAQLARTVGRALRLNEDLIEAIALGHDLGQPPFGPAGARALDDLLAGRLDGRGGPAFGDIGGFSSAWQALRVVDRVEKRYARSGLNLTDAVRDGIVKCGAHSSAPEDELQGTRIGRAASFEGQVVALADRVSVALSDLDDAMQSGVADLSRVERLIAVRELRKKLGRAYPIRAGRFVKSNVIHRGLTHLLVTGMVLASGRGLKRWSTKFEVGTSREFAELPDDAVSGDEIRLGRVGSSMLDDIEGFLESGVRRGFQFDRIEGRGRRVVLGLFAAYFADPSLLEDHVLLRFKELAGVRFLRDVPRDAREREAAERYRGDPRWARSLVDHLAAMTDGYAVAEHFRLLEMGGIPIPSAEQLRRER